MANPQKNQLGQKLKSAIKDKGVTQREVAKHFGVRPPSVNGWIANGRIDKKHIPKLVTYFEKPYAWWLDNGAVNAEQVSSHTPAAVEKKPKAADDNDASEFKKLITAYADLNRDGQHQVKMLAVKLLKAQTAHQKSIDAADRAKTKGKA